MDINTGLAFATVVLSVPSAALATIDAFQRRSGAVVADPWPAPSYDPPEWWAAPRPRPTPERTTSTMATRRVSLPRRILSYLIDLYSWILAGAFVDGALFGAEAYEEDGAGGVGLLVVAVAIVWVEARTGRSPGKLVVGARLVPAGDADTLSFWRVLWRHVVASFASILLVSQFAALSNDERRTLHDRWTATRVIRTR